VVDGGVVLVLVCGAGATGKDFGGMVSGEGR